MNIPSEEEAASILAKAAPDMKKVRAFVTRVTYGDAVVEMLQDLAKYSDGNESSHCSSYYSIGGGCRIVATPPPKISSSDWG